MLGELIKKINRINIRERPLPNIKRYNGVSGCGKTWKDLVLWQIRVGIREIRKAAAKKYGSNYAKVLKLTTEQSRHK